MHAKSSRTYELFLTESEFDNRFTEWVEQIKLDMQKYDRVKVRIEVER